MILTEETFFLFAAGSYDNPNCESIEEFKEDILRFKYLKKLLYSYKKKGQLKERLILNHFVILYNVFESKACTKMIILKLEEYLDCVVPFLELLGYLPAQVTGIYDKDFILDTNSIPVDELVKRRVKEIARGK